VGSRTLVEAAKSGEETHGVYMTDCDIKGEVSPWIRSEQGIKTQSRVYKELLAYLESIESGITKNI
jgi:hypothetical protein